MKTIGRITRILAYLIFIILGVLAIATPILLADYWFSGGIQHDFECIALVMDNPLCQAGFLVIGIVGVLGNATVAVASIWTSVLAGLPGLILQWGLVPLIMFWVEHRAAKE